MKALGKIGFISPLLDAYPVSGFDATVAQKKGQQWKYLALKTSYFKNKLLWKEKCMW